MKKRGQVAIEYLMIIGFSLFTITILMIVYAENSSQQGSDLTYSQMNKIGNKIVNTAEDLFYRGQGARKTISIYIPQSVLNATIENHSLIFNIDTGNGLSQLDFPSDVMLQGEFNTTQGLKHITIVADINYVCIVEKGKPECP